MNPVIIRNLKPEDTEIISFIENRLAPLWKLPVEEIRNDFILPSFEGSFPYMYIAETEDGDFAGEIILSIEKNWFLGIDNQVWISAVYVPEKFRRQGIARKLIAKTEEIARSHGYKKIYLDTIDAAGYYHKIGGWQEIGKDTWKGEEVTIMAKEL